MHFYYIEQDVWFTNQQMLDKLYTHFIKMSFFMFKSLVQHIRPLIIQSPIFVG
jgi:hypothetical protein